MLRAYAVDLELVVVVMEDVLVEVGMDTEAGRDTDTDIITEFVILNGWNKRAGSRSVVPDDRSLVSQYAGRQVEWPWIFTFSYLLTIA